MLTESLIPPLGAICGLIWIWGLFGLITGPWVVAGVAIKQVTQLKPKGSK